MTQSRRDIGVVLIAIFKLLKALLLLALGFGAIRLLHRDVAEVAEQWISVLRMDPNNRYVNRLLGKLFSLNDRKLAEISAGTFIYAAVFLTEGGGLLLQKRWAEYLTVVVTASFIPLELWELSKRVSALKLVAIILNVAVVLYLAWHVKHRAAQNGRREERP